MSVLRRAKLRTPDGTESIEYPLGVEAKNVEVTNGENLSQRLVRIDEDLEKNEEDIAAVSELASTNKQNIGVNEIRIDALERRSASAEAKADQAILNSATAQGTANTANTNAINAQNTANTANTNAQNAQTTANSASTSASNANTKIDGASIVGEYTSGTETLEISLELGEIQQKGE